MGLASIYTSMIIGQVKYYFPHINDYPDIGKLLFGSTGYHVVAAMFFLLLVLTTGR